LGNKVLLQTGPRPTGRSGSKKSPGATVCSPCIGPSRSSSLCRFVGDLVGPPRGPVFEDESGFSVPRVFACSHTHAGSCLSRRVDLTCLPISQRPPPFWLFSTLCAVHAFIVVLSQLRFRIHFAFFLGNAHVLAAAGAKPASISNSFRFRKLTLPFFRHSPFPWGVGGVKVRLLFFLATFPRSNP